MRYLLLGLGMVLSSGSAELSTVRTADEACGTCGSYLWCSTDVPKLYPDFTTHAFTGSSASIGESRSLFLRASTLPDVSVGEDEPLHSAARNGVALLNELCGGAEPSEGQECEHLFSSSRKFDSHGYHATHGPYVCSDLHASCGSMAVIPNDDLQRLMRGGTAAQLRESVATVLALREFRLDAKHLVLFSCSGTVEVRVPLTSELREAVRRFARANV